MGSVEYSVHRSGVRAQCIQVRSIECSLHRPGVQNVVYIGEQDRDSVDRLGE